jgi:hypothetical protein
MNKLYCFGILEKGGHRLAFAVRDVRPSRPSLVFATHRNSFIGHGQSYAWRDLKDFIAERLNLDSDASATIECAEPLFSPTPPSSAAPSPSPTSPVERTQSSCGLLLTWCAWVSRYPFYWQLALPNELFVRYLSCGVLLPKEFASALCSYFHHSTCPELIERRQHV